MAHNILSYNIMASWPPTLTVLRQCCMLSFATSATTPQICQLHGEATVSVGQTQAHQKLQTFQATNSIQFLHYNNYTHNLCESTVSVVGCRSTHL
jgi:hypothetical protein